MMFKPGDKVLCVNAGRVQGIAGDCVTSGVVYEVARGGQTGPGNVWIRTQHGIRGLFPSRFKLVREAPERPDPWLSQPTRVDAGPGTL
jgi:hypothetical protein